jgi:hypothetical protein
MINKGENVKVTKGSCLTKSEIVKQNQEPKENQEPFKKENLKDILKP